MRRSRVIVAVAVVAAVEPAVSEVGPVTAVGPITVVVAAESVSSMIAGHMIAGAIDA
jgi:hypothetical protein